METVFSNATLLGIFGQSVSASLWVFLNEINYKKKRQTTTRRRKRPHYRELFSHENGQTVLLPELKGRQKAAVPHQQPNL